MTTTTFESKLSPVMVELRKKTTSELCEYAKTLIGSDDPGATVAWVAVLTVLENERMTKEEYRAFEESFYA